MYGNFDFV
jgi:chromosome segregation ATPase